MLSIRTYFECCTRSQKKNKRKTYKLTHFNKGNKKTKNTKFKKKVK